MDEMDQTQPSTTLERSSSSPPFRSIDKLERFARIPVWPAWNGALLFILSQLPFIPNHVTAKLEDQFGGRVCPNFFSEPIATSPFLLLVHHVHSFTQFDPLRFFQKSVILPEGFPSHPHRGFITLTYCLKGGMVHRDSLGCKQVYGADEEGTSRTSGNVAQWLVAGAGMLHEEMWDIHYNFKNLFTSKQELYQLWINLPSIAKMTEPSVCLVNTHDTTSDDTLTSDDNHDGDVPELKRDGDNLVASAPIVRSKCGQSETIVLVGDYNGASSNIETASPMSILHVRLNPKSEEWRMSLPKSFQTVIVYMRSGSVTLLDGNNNSSFTSSNNNEDTTTNIIPTHHTAFLSSTGDELVLKGDEKLGADFMVLAGAPIREPVESQGSMVMTNPMEINQAYQDYSQGLMGRPWDDKLTDDEWKKHVAKFPSLYK